MDPDDSPKAAEENGYSRAPSSRVKDSVNYDEKQHLEDLKEDISHGVARQTTLAELEEHLDEDSDEWDSQSIFEDMYDELFEDKFFPDVPGACTPEEAVGFRQMLRSIGPQELCKRTLDTGFVSARKLLTAFGVRPPPPIGEEEDDALALGLLIFAFGRELSKRAKLLKYNTIDDAVNLLQTSKNIVVLTGAGISTSLGIPDFRSKGTGLYSQLEHLGLSDPQEVFDLRIFKHDPTIFYSVAKDILPSTERFSPTHAFIALLQQKGKLLTNYSQNIDNLEAKAGIRPEKLVQCHGSFATATCVKCGYKVPGETIFPDMKAGNIPRCGKCSKSTRKPANGGNKRKLNKDGTEKKPRRRPGEYDSNSDSEFDTPSSSSGGVMKPDIIFFGEQLPESFSKRLTEHDRDLVDLVIVIGTSLKVAPVSELVPFLHPNTPQINISRDGVPHVNFDIDLLGDCDIVVAEMCRRAGWDLDHEMIPEGQVVDVELAQGYASRHIFTQVKPEPKPKKVEPVVKPNVED